MLLRELFPPDGGMAPQIRNLKQVAFFPRMGVAFNRLQKNGSSLAITFLHFLEYGYQERARRAKNLTVHFSDMGVRGVFALMKAKRIVIVRDPFSRTLSAFLDKFRSPSFQRKFGPFELSPVGFSAFLSYLEAGGLRTNSHWSPQTDRMALAPRHYDAIIPFSAVPGQFLASLRDQAPGVEAKWSNFMPTEMGGPPQTNARTKVSLFYSRQDIERVESLYKTDLELTTIRTEADRMLDQAF